jgi:MFS family permease
MRLPDSAINWIMICTLISNSAYAIIAPFLPIEFADKGVEGSIVGIIFAIYSIAVIFASPQIAKYY